MFQICKFNVCGLFMDFLFLLLSNLNCSVFEINALKMVGPYLHFKHHVYFVKSKHKLISICDNMPM